MHLKIIRYICAIAASAALLAGCGWLSGGPADVNVSVCINEFMASNTDSTFVDEYGETDDWIELYNYGDESVSLDELFLTDDSKDLQEYALPDISIPSKGYYLVWADNDPSQGENHAAFKLSALDGEEVILSARNGVIIDQVQFFIGTETYGKILPDESYGRQSDGDTAWGIQSTPTPGKPNAGIVP